MLDSAGEIFAWQHDPEPLGNGVYTFFDNESSGAPLLPYSRAVTVRLNPWTHVATLLSSDNQPEGLSAASQGNAQTTADGDLFVGWGALPYFSEFNRQGNLIFNAEFPAGVNTYRAYLLPWNPPGGPRSPWRPWSAGGPGNGQPVRPIEHLGAPDRVLAPSPKLVPSGPPAPGRRDLMLQMPVFESRSYSETGTRTA